MRPLSPPVADHDGVLVASTVVSAQGTLELDPHNILYTSWNYDNIRSIRLAFLLSACRALRNVLIHPHSRKDVQCA